MKKFAVILCGCGSLDGSEAWSPETVPVVVCSSDASDVSDSSDASSCSGCSDGGLVSPDSDYDPASDPLSVSDLSDGSDIADDDPRIAQQVAGFLRQTTLKAVVLHLVMYAGILSIPIPEVDCRRYKTCWGKCIPDRELIIFNERLVMLPEDLIVYVVAHECVHFHHRNHSKDFYRMLRSIMPDADDRLKRLKTYSSEYLPEKDP